MYVDSAVIITGLIIIFLLQACTFAIVSKMPQKRVSEKSEEWYKQQINEKDKTIAEIRIIRDNLAAQNVALKRSIMITQSQEKKAGKPDKVLTN